MLLGLVEGIFSDLKGIKIVYPIMCSNIQTSVKLNFLRL
jgi:hypothetical protein